MADLHGSEAEWLKVQAMQLLLRYQTQELKKLSELPDVFEVSLGIPCFNTNSLDHCPGSMDIPARNFAHSRPSTRSWQFTFTYA